MIPPPVCSVIIPSYRSAKTIRATLAALLAQDFGQPYDITVVDSSDDDTPQIIANYFPQVRVIHLDQKTDPARARNLGAHEAQGAVLAFIDADCVAAPDWLRRLYETVRHGYDAVGGAITNADGETAASWAGYFCEFREFLPEGAAHDVDNLTLGNVAYPRDLFWSVSGFPEGCFPQEDQVFHQTLRVQGRRIRYDPHIRVAHTHRADVGAFLRHQRFIGQTNARVVLRLNLSGVALARRPWLTLLALPALVPYRFLRTMRACWSVERHILLRRPAIAWLCWWGMWCWGWGFFEGARDLADTEYAIRNSV
jgi:glycosyltransferase involved in cell wall biosynthesis